MRFDPRDVRPPNAPDWHTLNQHYTTALETIASLRARVSSLEAVERENRILIESREALSKRVADLEAAKQSWADGHAQSLGLLTPEHAAELRQRIAELTTRLAAKDAARRDLKAQLFCVRQERDGLDCTLREGGERKHCPIHHPCWRCRAEQAEAKLATIERDTLARARAAVRARYDQLSEQNDGEHIYAIGFKDAMDTLDALQHETTT